MSKVVELTSQMKSAGRRYSSVRAVDSLSWAQEKAFVGELLRNSDKLRACTPESVANAVLQAGAMGLSLNPLAKHVYLIPRSYNAGTKEQPQWEKRCYASPSYMGLIHVLVSSGSCRQANAAIVFRAEVDSGAFVNRGPFTPPHHEPAWDAAKRREEDAVGAYAIFRLPDGGVSVAYMDREQILRCRAMSDSPDSIMWSKDRLWTEGWCKAVLRRGVKTIQRPDRVMYMEGVLDQNEGITIEHEPRRKSLSAVAVLQEEDPSLVADPVVAREYAESIREMVFQQDDHGIAEQMAEMDAAMSLTVGRLLDSTQRSYVKEACARIKDLNKAKGAVE